MQVWLGAGDCVTADATLGDHRSVCRADAASLERPVNKQLVQDSQAITGLHMSLPESNKGENEPNVEQTQ